MIDHEDADHRIDRAGILPRPKRPIPIWLGGFSDAAYDRAARIGDGFLFSGRTQAEAVQIKARIEARLRELGRDADTFGFESIQQYSRRDNQWPRDIAAWREAGGSHSSVVTMGAKSCHGRRSHRGYQALAGCLRLGRLEFWRPASILEPTGRHGSRFCESSRRRTTGPRRYRADPQLSAGWRRRDADGEA